LIHSSVILIAIQNWFDKLVTTFAVQN
jgi:hypothetical protein